jgi:hypothetical protein
MKIETKMLVKSRQKKKKKKKKKKNVSLRRKRYTINRIESNRIESNRKVEWLIDGACISINQQP